MSAALILFAHGARDPRWAEPFLAIAERIRLADPARPVELAFLELMEPDLGEAARHLAAGGATRIDVVPLFLGMGGHLRNDLPPRVDAVRAALPAVEFRLHAAIGENEAVIAVVASAALAAARFGE
jgi:sirohydrochlorin cobaltochelatase